MIILEPLAEEDEGLRGPETTRRLGLPRATTHEFVNTLIERGFLTTSKTTGRVSLEVKALRLAAGYERGLDLATVGRECAAEVAEASGETVQIVVRDGAFVVFIVRIDSRHSVRLLSQVGSRLLASCTAGREGAAEHPPDCGARRAVRHDDALQKMTRRSIDTRERLLAELDRCPRAGAGPRSTASPTTTLPASPRRCTTAAARACGHEHVGAHPAVGARPRKRPCRAVLVGAKMMSQRLGAPMQP